MGIYSQDGKYIYFGSGAGYVKKYDRATKTVVSKGRIGDGTISTNRPIYKQIFSSIWEEGVIFVFGFDQNALIRKAFISRLNIDTGVSYNSFLFSPGAFSQPKAI
jgi:hypothetical protein